MNLTVIGADSTLFRKPVSNVKNVTLASAERVEFLLLIDGDNGFNKVDSDIHRIFLVSDN